MQPRNPPDRLVGGRSPTTKATLSSASSPASRNFHLYAPQLNNFETQTVRAGGRQSPPQTKNQISLAQISQSDEAAREVRQICDLLKFCKLKLPDGWTRELDSEAKVVYQNQVTNMVSTIHPRLANLKVALAHLQRQIYDGEHHSKAKWQEYAAERLKMLIQHEKLMSGGGVVDLPTDKDSANVTQDRVEQTSPVISLPDTLDDISIAERVLQDPEKGSKEVKKKKSQLLVLLPVEAEPNPDDTATKEVQLEIGHKSSEVAVATIEQNGDKTFAQL